MEISANKVSLPLTRPQHIPVGISHFTLLRPAQVIAQTVERARGVLAIAVYGESAAVAGGVAGRVVVGIAVVDDG